MNPTQSKAIVDDVVSGGTKSLISQALRLGDIKSESDPLLLGAAEMKAAFDRSQRRTSRFSSEPRFVLQ